MKPIPELTRESSFADIKAHIDRRAEEMPTEKDAMAVMVDAFSRLKDLGWKEAIYCPKDGTPFLAIEAGCGAAGVCQYLGEWPKGSWWMHSGGDLWPSRPVLFKPMDPKPATPSGTPK